jgi:hypothetical protein
MDVEIEAVESDDADDSDFQIDSEFRTWRRRKQSSEHQTKIIPKFAFNCFDFWSIFDR